MNKHFNWKRFFIGLVVAQLLLVLSVFVWGATTGKRVCSGGVFQIYQNEITIKGNHAYKAAKDQSIRRDVIESELSQILEDQLKAFQEEMKIAGEITQQKINWYGEHHWGYNFEYTFKSTSVERLEYLGLNYLGDGDCTCEFNQGAKRAHVTKLDTEVRRQLKAYFMKKYQARLVSDGGGISVRSNKK